MNKDLASLKNRILQIRDNLSPISSNEMSRVENMLDIKLSDEFITLNTLHSYECFRLFEFYNWCQIEDYSVIGETLGYRKNLNLPHEYLVFSEDDVTCVFMQTKPSPDEPSPVILCPIEEVDDLCATNTIPKNAEIFKTFTDFYEYLLDQEEKQQQENQRTQMGC